MGVVWDVTLAVLLKCFTSVVDYYYFYVFFIDPQELAKRFALSFGLDALKNREAITAVHRAGIQFAVQDWGGAEGGIDPGSPPPHLMFLEILAEFTNKLLKQDKRVVWVPTWLNHFAIYCRQEKKFHKLEHK